MERNPLVTREDKLEYDRKWRERNREKVRESQNKYKEANSERTRQQRKETFKRYYEKNKEVMREKGRRQQRSKEQIMLTGAKVRAKKNRIPFEITLEDITIPDVCPVLGIDIVAGIGKLTPNSPSLDRILPEKGYVKGNICVISHRANSIKSNGNIEEHEAVISYMKKFLTFE